MHKAHHDDEANRKKMGSLADPNRTSLLPPHSMELWIVKIPENDEDEV